MFESIPIALVTGAGRGLGRGIARHLSSLGFSVIVNYVNDNKAAEETVKLCEDSKVNNYQNFISIKADVGLRHAREKLIEESLNKFGRIDALINNAGVGPRIRRDVLDLSEDSFNDVMRTNLEGPFFLTQSIAKIWLEQKPKPALKSGFKIIFISSISAETVSTNRAEYCISKAGLSMVTKLWAVRTAAEGIHVFELRPGIMITDMTKPVKDKYNKIIDEGTVPQKRWGEPNDVARAVGVLLAGEFPYSTGEVIYIDGGFHIQKL